MPRPGADRAARIVLLCALPLLPLYLVTRSHVHGWDPSAYAARAHDHPWLSERYLSTRLLHPHHLLYMPLARWFARAIPARDPFLPLQVLSAAGAALAALAAGWTVRARGGHAARAAFATLGVGLAYGTWRYGAEAEVMTPALAMLLLGVLALATARGRAGRFTLAGLALAAATLLHQPVAVFVLAALAVLTIEAWRRRVAPAAPAGLALAWLVPVVAFYLWAAARSAHPHGMAAWLVGAAGRAERFTSAGGLPSLATLGAIGALVPQQPFTDLRWTAPRTAAMLAGGLLALGVLVAAAALLARALPGIARAVRDGDALTRALVAGVVALAAAIGFFQPWNEEYWVYVPPLLTVLVMLHLPAERAVPRVAWGALGALLVLGVAYGWWPRRVEARAPYAETLAFARSQLAPGDLVLGTAEELGTALIALPLLAGVDALPAPAAGDPGAAARVGAAVRIHLGRIAAARGSVVATPGGWPAVARAAGSGWRLEPFGTLAGRPVARLVAVGGAAAGGTGAGGDSARAGPAATRPPHHAR